MLCHARDGIDELLLAQTDVAAMTRQAVLDLGKLLGRDFHAPSSALYAPVDSSVDTT